MKKLIDYIKESYEELITDYDAADSASGNEKKALSSKYGTANKIKDIQKAILLKMREERHNRKEFTVEDITNFTRLDFPEKKLYDELGEEPIEFVRFYADYYLQQLKKRRLDRMIGQKLNSYSSASDRYMLKRYETILAYLTANDKTDEEKAKDKLDKERYEMIRKNLIDKITIELEDFKNKIIEMTKRFAKRKYEEAQKIIERCTAEIKELEQMLVGKSFYEYYKSKEYKRIEILRKTKSKEGMILSKYSNYKEYEKACVDEAIKQFELNIEAIAERVKEKGLNIENVTCKDVFDDPKFIEMRITDGDRSLWCRSILAAESSTKMIPHFRFIITERAGSK
jgi:hypothetical protein